MQTYGGTTDEAQARGGSAPDLPVSAWLLGWTSVAGQLAYVAQTGVRMPEMWPVDVLFGAFMVFLVHGVLRARMVRFGIVMAAAVVQVLGSVVELVLEPTAWEVAAAILSLAQLALLVVFSQTSWFAWQRRGGGGGPSLVPLLVLASVVAALGAVIDFGPSPFE